jgi:serine/threonine-protein kinase
MGDAKPDPMIGKTFGPYVLKRELGKGGMGKVYEAYDTVMEREVALKLMSAKFSNDPEYRKRLQREALLAGRLQEPHVVPIHGSGEIDGQLYVDMRLIDGTDLRTIIKRYGPLAPARAVAIVGQIASALDAAHRADTMHRDVKPANILITGDNVAYLADFGLAKQFGATNAGTREKLTQTGMVMGSWAYMAPEQFDGIPDRVTRSVDIYALACVLYECLTGSAPYQGNQATLPTAHQLKPIPRPSAQRGGIPAAFDSVIARGMAKTPSDRYPTAGQLAVASREALSTPEQDRADSIMKRSTIPLDNPTIDRQPSPMPARPPRAQSPLPAPQPPLRSPVPTPNPWPAVPAPPTPPPWPAVPTVATPPPWSAVPTAETPPPRPAVPASGMSARPAVPASGMSARPAVPASVTNPSWPVSSPPVTSGPTVLAPGLLDAGGGAGSRSSQPPAPPPEASSASAHDLKRHRRNPWLLLGIAAAVLIVVLGGAGIWLATHPAQHVRSQHDLPFTQLNKPGGVTVDAAGDVFVCDAGDDVVEELPAGSNQPTRLSIGGLKSCTAIAAAPNGAVFIADPENNQVLKRMPGDVVTKLAFHGLNRPSGVAVDKTGNVYVADAGNERIMKLPTGPNPTAKPQAFAGVRNFSDVEVDSAGNIYAADSGTNQVLKMVPGGGNPIRLPFEGLNFPNGAAIDAAGNVYVSDSKNNRVVELPAGTKNQIVLPLNGLNGPGAIAVDRRGDLFVADTGNDRVVELSAR